MDFDFVASYTTVLASEASSHIFRHGKHPIVTLTITKPVMTLSSTTDNGNLTTIVEYDKKQCIITTKNDVGARSVIVQDHASLTATLDQHHDVSQRDRRS